MTLTPETPTSSEQLSRRPDETGTGRRNVDIFLPVMAFLMALFVVGLTLGWYGSDWPGIDVATRSSARCSALVFAVAVAMRLGSSGVALMRAFIATHLVHYGTVSYEAVTNVHHRLHTLDAWDGVVIISGVLLLLALALARFQRGTVWRRLNAVATFLVGATFAGGAALNATRYWTALIPVIPLLAGLTIHLFRCARGSTIKARLHAEPANTALHPTAAGAIMSGRG
jgi:hypothetical protein